MKLIAIVVTTFFAVLDGLALLNELLEHLTKAKPRTRINRGRRAFVIIVLSAIITPIVVAYSHLRREKTARALSILRELEIRLTQKYAFLS